MSSEVIVIVHEELIDQKLLCSFESGLLLALTSVPQDVAEYSEAAKIGNE